MRFVTKKCVSTATSAPPCFTSVQHESQNLSKGALFRLDVTNLTRWRDSKLIWKVLELVRLASLTSFFLSLQEASTEQGLSLRFCGPPQSSSLIWIWSPSYSFRWRLLLHTALGSSTTSMRWDYASEKLCIIALHQKSTNMLYCYFSWRVLSGHLMPLAIRLDTVSIKVVAYSMSQHYWTVFQLY